MIQREITTDESLAVQLCRTYSSERLKLKQIDTGLVYGYECVDVIAGFDSDGAPYSAHKYEETDELDAPEEDPFAEYEDGTGLADMRR